jgi:hypothetical protein
VFIWKAPSLTSSSSHRMRLAYLEYSGSIRCFDSGIFSWVTMYLDVAVDGIDPFLSPVLSFPSLTCLPIPRPTVGRPAPGVIAEVRCRHETILTGRFVAHVSGRSA